MAVFAFLCRQADPSTLVELLRAGKAETEKHAREIVRQARIEKQSESYGSSFSC